MLGLIEEVRRVVQEQTGVELELEVKLWDSRAETTEDAS